MGGEHGNRGYLVQTIIALLNSLSDESWEYVRIEPSVGSEKVDILWEGRRVNKAVQVKSSINQIGKADAERWATELKTGVSADSYELVLVGPCAQSVVELGSCQGVSIPPPKNLDIEGLLSQAAHLLDKFLEAAGLDRQSATLREIMVNALTTRLSAWSTPAKSLSRSGFITLIKEWLSAITFPITSKWEPVSFENQRGIENAVAGKRLGPSDVAACPEFSICSNIVIELNRSHLHEIVGTPGCGKSITGWHVARRFQRAGFSIWRPRLSAKPEELIDSIPSSHAAFLVVDDAHHFGRLFAERLSESSGPDTKVLLISTVEEPLQSSIICISPERSVQELATALLGRRDELLPIIRSYDDRIGNRYGDTSYEFRVQQARKEKKPWEFFWVLRGGWQTARREFETVKQFSHAADVLLLIAVGQIASCDAGVPHDWIGRHALQAGIDNTSCEKVLARLASLDLVLEGDPVRTKHVSYAYRIVEESFRSTNLDTWPRFSGLFLECLLNSGWSLRGIAWALDSIRIADAFLWRKNQFFQGLVEPITKRSINERHDLDWAAGCLSRLFTIFDASTEEILKHRSIILEWSTSRPGLVSYFCGDIINHVINRSINANDNFAREFIDSVDAAKLAVAANTVAIEDLHTFGRLLDRLAFYGPTWAGQFFARFDWDRAKEIILKADPDRAFAVDAFISGLSLLGRKDDIRPSLWYIEETIPYVSKAINATPTDAVEEMDGIFWTCLGYAPKPFRGGWLPDEDQTRIAEHIVAQVHPQPFARAMEKAIPRDLEKLARSFEIIREIDPDFIKNVAGCLSETDFFAATQDDWKEQSGELQRLISFFCLGEDFEPGATWVRKNKHLMTGPLCTLFTCIAPKVAIEFHKDRKGIEIVNPRHAFWQYTTLAVKRVAELDRQTCAEVVIGQVDKLREAMYSFGPDSPVLILRFWRTLYDLSPDLFERLARTLNLEDKSAKSTIQEVVRNHPKERIQYAKLAKCGLKLTGTIANLSKELLRRLTFS